ncbi:uncharacterized protein LAESUDRAFT_765302 [Laetiporus sulphureus 93-53]|uniref:Uncharacterized protein n=1 Tax=Laetiporus sulphureus 93-53 TaxID=1314785 RepID=A0A165AU12_9APHY|nr:uncharacterized protein LAESUDRAFT_765302 [Laetiporus sulphureus 93-53]KZS99659.1 hypothetical protein LAESUDRAFT_765302 [Laetiporus sulphureus 93-53]
MASEGETELDELDSETGSDTESETVKAVVKPAATASQKREKHKKLKEAKAKARQANIVATVVKNDQIRYGSHSTSAHAKRAKRKAEEHKAKIDAGPKMQPNIKQRHRNHGRFTMKGFGITKDKPAVDQVVKLSAASEESMRAKTCMNVDCKKGHVFKPEDIVIIRALIGTRIKTETETDPEGHEIIAPVHAMHQKFVHLQCMSQSSLAFYQKQKNGITVVDVTKLDGLNRLPGISKTEIVQCIIKASKAEQVQKDKTDQKKKRHEHHQLKMKMKEEASRTVKTVKANVKAHKDSVKAIRAEAAKI